MQHNKKPQPVFCFRLVAFSANKFTGAAADWTICAHPPSRESTNCARGSFCINLLDASVASSLDSRHGQDISAEKRRGTMDTVVGGSDSSSGARIISNGNAVCMTDQSEPSPGPASAAHAATKEDDGKQNVPVVHSTSRGDGDTSSAGDDIARNERLDRRDGQQHHVVSDHGGQANGAESIPIPVPPIPAPMMQKIRRSGVRTKFMVESLRMEMITLQRQNAKLRRIVATRLPERSEVIFADCCSVSAAAAVAARESFVQRMAEELANLVVGGDDSVDDGDEDEAGENLDLYVSPDDDMADDHTSIAKEADEAAATDDKANGPNGEMGR